MAIDTAPKRGSSIGIAGPPVLPAADSTIDADDRRMTALSYSAGFVVEAPGDTVCFDITVRPALAFDSTAKPAIQHDTTAKPALDLDGEVGCT